MDLDELIRAELAAQAERAPDAAAVLAGVPARAHARRRTRAALTAAATAATAAAVLAATVPYAVLHAGPATPATGPAPGRTVLSDRALLERCLPPGTADRARTRVLVTHADERGYLAWLGGPTTDRYCAVGWDGTVDRRASGGESSHERPADAPRGWRPAGTGAQRRCASGSMLETDPATRRRLVGEMACGLVSREVGRVVVRWDGAPAVDATLAGPYWLARVTVEGRDAVLAGEPTVEAYDARGRLLSRVAGSPAPPQLHRAGAPPVQRRLGGAPTARKPAAGTRPGVVPADRVLVAACTAAAPADTGSALAGARVLAVHRDGRGFVVWVGGETGDLPDCAFRWDGQPDGGPSWSRVRDGMPLPRDYLSPGGGAAVEHASGGGGEPDPATGLRDEVLTAAGRVSGEVRRVVVRWDGAPPVTATVDGPSWLARVQVQTSATDLAAWPVVEAYDGAGRRLLSGG